MAIDRYWQRLNKSLQSQTVILRRERTYFVKTEVLTSPTAVARDTLQMIPRAENKAVLEVRHSLQQRTKIRLSFDCLVRGCKQSSYKRLKQMGCLLSCPTPEQAELAIEAILSFAQSLDGIWLTASPEPGQVAPVEPAKAQGVDSTASGDQPTIRSESADDLQEP